MGGEELANVDARRRSAGLVVQWNPGSHSMGTVARAGLSYRNVPKPKAALLEHRAGEVDWRLLLPHVNQLEAVAVHVVLVDAIHVHPQSPPARVGATISSTSVTSTAS
jgi:hypothetical protein